MPNYAVHVFGLCRIKIPDVRATSQRHAIELIMQNTNLIGAFRHSAEVCEEELPSHFLVDVHGDEEYRNSCFWHHETDKDNKLYLVHGPGASEERMRSFLWKIYRELVPTFMITNPWRKAFEEVLEIEMRKYDPDDPTTHPDTNHAPKSVEAMEEDRQLTFW